MGRFIDIVGEINGIYQKEREQIRAFAEQDQYTPVTLRITSPGGSIFSGYALMDDMLAIREEYPALRINGFVVSFAASMALSILQACDERTIGANAQLMAHGLTGGTGGDMDDIYRQLELLENITVRLAELYGARTRPLGGRSPQQWYETFQRNSEEWYDAGQSLRAGLVDRIVGR